MDEDEAGFAGEFVRFSPSWSWPKPAAEPHPPIVMGGAGGPVTFRHVVEYCDGWMPIHGRKEILPKLEELRRVAEEAGRDPTTISLGVFGAPAKPEILEDYAAPTASPASCSASLRAAPPRRWPRSTSTHHWSTASADRSGLAQAARPSPGPSGLWVPRSAEPCWNSSAAIGMAWSIVLERVPSWTQVR